MGHIGSGILTRWDKDGVRPKGSGMLDKLYVYSRKHSLIISTQDEFCLTIYEEEEMHESKKSIASFEPLT